MSCVYYLSVYMYWSIESPQYYYIGHTHSKLVPGGYFPSLGIRLGMSKQGFLLGGGGGGGGNR